MTMAELSSLRTAFWRRLCDMKKFLTVLIIILLFSFPVSADDLYEVSLEASGFNDIYDSAPENVTDFFENNNIDVFSPDFVSDLSSKNLIFVIFDFLVIRFHQLQIKKFVDFYH